MGLLLVLIAFFVGPGVPYQDPTPEMLAREAQQIRRSNQFLIAGGSLFAFGILWSIVRRVQYRQRRKGGA